MILPLLMARARINRVPPPVSTAYRDAVLADIPLGYWRLGEASGSIAADSSGNAHDANYVSCSQGASSLVNNNDGDLAVSGDGSTSQITVGAVAALYGLSRNCTIEAWLKPNFTAIGQASGIWSSGLGGIALRCVYNASGVQIEWLKDYTTSYHTWSTNIPNNTRFHVALVIDAAGTGNLYLNGTPFGSASPAASFNGSYVRIGADGRDASVVGSFLFGAIDEVAVYSTALSAARVNAHYSAGV